MEKTNTRFQTPRAQTSCSQTLFIKGKQPLASTLQTTLVRAALMLWEGENEFLQW